MKYKKSGKSICTIYPHEGFFTCLVVSGEKDAPEIELILETLDASVQTLYQSAVPMNGSKWLMIDVTSQKILDDVKELIYIRMNPQKLR